MKLSFVMTMLLGAVVFSPAGFTHATTPIAAPVDSEIRQTLNRAGLTLPIASISSAPFANLYEVKILGEEIPLYINTAVSHIIQGQISINPSPITPVQLPHGTSGSPITPAHRRALLANMSELGVISQDTPFYYTALDGVLWSIADGLPFLLSADGKYLLDGEISLIVNGQFVGLDQNFERQKNQHVFSMLDETQLITYQAINEKAVLYVATDVHCPYCRLLHKQYPMLNAQGITIKTIGYPVYEESFEPMRHLWCESNADTRKSLLNTAMNGIMPQPICTANQNNLVNNQHIASGLAIVATPAIYRADGALFEGDFQSEQLPKFLGVR
ncbi:MAG: thioredoxin fold domain-containing protein [Moraxella sp.]|nr:thioredoxin fold domain-containing protein [Moraxella sp.]